MPAQQGGSRASGPFPPSAPAWSKPRAWNEEELSELRRQRDYDLWDDCMGHALASLAPQLEEAWARAALDYRRRRVELEDLEEQLPGV